MKNKFWKSSLCLIVSLFAVACQSQTDSITYGCAGGFTGGGSGVKVFSDGRMIKWTSSVDGLSEEELSVNLDLTGDLFSRLEKLDVSSIKYQKFGNLTCTLIIQKEGISHSIAWSNSEDNEIEKIVNFSHRLENGVLNNE